ncbi:uncharacterized protein I303_103425 [Kwoniella dejecticola CBS 10117]|uniref:DNA-binding protein n=1 Tax=Kwoniella dejecticola CBS 10117 TaxID=1296121 RepID=A0A1A6A6Q1_9TREE|nr:uncharacterized protein I303_03447 [Kwoniella dejecticola CBS 10117]OBR85736.1 hypothetical protein I303_03447 [Kwoniella dejecticola CBS 10117]
MVKSEQEVVSDFNEIVNMTADELEEFLKTEGSETTGFQKEDGSGESIGHESGRKIVDILKRNSSKDPSKYTDEDKEHMRKVVSYCKRHLAQEGKLKETKGPEELEKSKSTRSLKNWGHDPMKTLSKSEQPKKSDKPTSKKAEKPTSKKAEKPASKKAASAEKPKSKGGKASTEKEEKEDGQEDKADEKAKETEKPQSKGRGRPPKNASSSAAAPDTEEAKTGEKREGEDKKSEKPASKKAKTTKEPTEGTRKPPSRGVKKA